MSLREARKMLKAILSEIENTNDFGDYEETDVGFAITYGSTTVYIQAYENEDLAINMLNFRADLAHDVDASNVSRKTALGLLEFNWNMPLGNVSLEEDEGIIWFEYNLPLDLVSEETAAWLIGVVAGAADQIDDDITELVGGE